MKNQDQTKALRLLAHDLNNPLMAVRITAEMMLEDTTDDQVRRDAKDILEAADLGAAVISGLTAALRVQAEQEPDYTWFPVDVAQQVIEPVLSRPAFRQYSSSSVAAGMTISGDYKALQQALCDTMVFARRATRADQVIHLSPVSRGRGILVRCPGSAIPEESYAKLVEPWGAASLRASRVPTSAMGLHYARVVCESHGGTLSIHCDGKDLVLRLQFHGG